MFGGDDAGAVVRLVGGARIEVGVGVGVDGRP